MTTRKEHLEWCKQQARDYCAEGDVQSALIGMASDLGKHPETAKHVGIQMMVMMTMTGGLSDAASTLKFINGFN